MTAGRRLRRLASMLALGVALLLLPDAGPAPNRLSLTKVEEARSVDFEDGVVWFLALGSDARPGQDMLEARADAIELVALDLESGSAVAIGIPRDSWVELGEHGFGKINEALFRGQDSTELMVNEVTELTEITPDYVAVTDLAGFAGLVDSMGGVSVRSAFDFEDIPIKRGINRNVDGQVASEFARSRDIAGDDFARMGHQQALLRGILQRVREREDQLDFIEDGAVAALRYLDTDLSPSDLYRLAQAISAIEPKRFATCVIGGRPDTVGVASVVYIDQAQALRVAQDAADDAVLQGGC